MHIRADQIVLEMRHSNHAYTLLTIYAHAHSVTHKTLPQTKFPQNKAILTNYSLVPRSQEKGLVRV